MVAPNETEDWTSERASGTRERGYDRKRRLQHGPHVLQSLLGDQQEALFLVGIEIAHYLAVGRLMRDNRVSHGAVGRNGLQRPSDLTLVIAPSSQAGAVSDRASERRTRFAGIVHGVVVQMAAERLAVSTWAPRKIDANRGPALSIGKRR